MCSVLGCDSQRRGAGRFNLPEDPERRLAWVQFVFEVNGQRLKESSCTDISICSEHFTEDCFETRTGAVELNATAAPSLWVKSESEEPPEFGEPVDTTDVAFQNSLRTENMFVQRNGIKKENCQQMFIVNERCLFQLFRRKCPLCGCKLHTEKVTRGLLIILNQHCLRCGYRNQWQSQENADAAQRAEPTGDRSSKESVSEIVTFSDDESEEGWSPLEEKEEEEDFISMARYHSVAEAMNTILDGNASDMEQLGEDDDDEEEEEWFTSARMEKKSNCSDEEEDSEEDTTNPNDTKPKQSTSSKVEGEEYQWKRKRFEAPAVEFEKCVEEHSEDRLTWTPYMYFKDFVTEEMLQGIAGETNSYSVQKDGTSVHTNAKEIEQILGMYLHMGLNQMPNVRAYWEMETRYPAVCDVMSRGRFLKLLTLVHFRDNLDVSEGAKADKLWKLRPWLEQLRRRFLRVPPEECHAVHEITVPFRGKSRLRRYVPGKPHKWGFKMWGRVGRSGLLYDFDVSQGPERPDKEKPDVVLRMTSTLPAGQNHKVFAGDGFTSVPLVEQLKRRGIYYIGTVRTDRVKDCPLMDEKELKKKGRGSLDFRLNQEGVIIVRWCNNKAVNLISSFVGIEPLGNAKRWDRNAKRHTTVPRPAIVDTFNRFMGGVELLDTLTALYKYNFRSRRWYLYVWWHTVTVAVINAWLRYKRDLEKLKSSQKPLPLRRFQAHVATSLTSAGKGKVCGRALSSPEAAAAAAAAAAPPRKRKCTVTPPDVIRDGIGHFPTWETRQRCKRCTGHFTHVCCVKCNVHLCLNKIRNCFRAYHLAK